MKIIGLTGSIAMGKSTVAQYLRRCRIPVFDADKEVHRLYDKGGAAVPLIAKLVPECVEAGRVDRSCLAQAMMDNPALWPSIEATVHPLVQARQRRFLQQARRARRPMVVVDIPLLLEKRTPGRYDAICVVSANPFLQEIRALRREGMTKEKLHAIRANQLPEPLKKLMATHVIRTGLGKGHAVQQVRRMLDELRQLPRARRIYFAKRRKN